MSDHEIENIVWDEFDESSHHTVPHQGGSSVNEAATLGDFLKKPQNIEGNYAGKSTSSRGSKNKNVLLGKEEVASCLSPKDGSSTLPECSRTHASRKVVSAFYDPNSFGGFTSRTSQDDAGLVFVESEETNRENDLLYHDLPDIGNFEDMDRLLRTCDSTFGQGSSIAEELSWFSTSSHSTYGIGDTSKSCSQSSVLYSASLNGTSANRSITNILPENDLLAANSDKILSHGHQSFALVSDSENKGDYPLQEKTYDEGEGTEIKSTLMQVSNESSLNACDNLNTISMHSKELGRQYLFEGNENDRCSETTRNNSFSVPGQMQKIADQGNLSSVFSAQEPCSYQNFPKQNHFWGSDSSSYMHTFSPHAQLEGTLHQDLFTHTMPSILSGSEHNPSSSYKISAHVGNYFPQCMENLPVPLSGPPAIMSEEIDEKPCLGQNFCSSLTVKHLPHLAPSTSITSCQQQHHRFQQETRGDNVQKDKNLKFPATDVDSSTVQESPYMISAFSDDISLKATSFQQLHDVMIQLDIGTKLCIRDSLYRLAKSAEKRHNFACASNSSREIRGGILDTEEPTRSSQSRHLHIAQFLMRTSMLFETCLQWTQSLKHLKRSAEYTTKETATNPIDRSIAHLLFHRWSETVTRSTESAISLDHI